MWLPNIELTAQAVQYFGLAAKTTLRRWLTAVNVVSKVLGYGLGQ